MTGSVLRVAQISDAHIPREADTLYRGFNARRNFDRVLAAVRAWSPDLVLATGDLSEDGSQASYAFLAERLNLLHTRVLTVPGNHDDAIVQRGHFPETPLEAPLTEEVGGWQAVMLNSADEGAVAGRLDGGQLESLDTALAAGESPAIVALHHQPVSVGSLWIDRYPLLEPQRFWRVVARHRRVKAVLWGHIHQGFETTVDSVRALGCPSTVCNSLPAREAFTVDPEGPACRWLELWPDGRLATGLLRSPG